MHYTRVIYRRVLPQLLLHQCNLLLANYEAGTQRTYLANQYNLPLSGVKMRIERVRNRYKRIRAEEEC